MVNKVKRWVHRFAKSSGIKRHEHDFHAITLRRFILCICLFSLVIVGISSWVFYKDPRSKYDLVRPGRRDLPDSFRADDESTTAESKDDVKLEIQRLQGQLNSLDAYGNFNDDRLGDPKVLQNYLDQPVIDQ